MSQKPIAFMSYVNMDDQHEQGRLTQFRERLSGEVRMQTGAPFDIFQDRQDIAWGQQWQECINESLNAVTFLIPIITPGFFKSDFCRKELERFLKREEELGRSDLILPVYYLNCLILEDKEKLKHDSLAQIIAARQRADWRHLRFKSFDSEQVGETISKLAEHIVKSLERSKVEPSVFVSVIEDGVELRYDADISSEVLFSLPMGYPLEVICRKGEWVNVRDYEQDEGWVAANLVSDTPYLIVKAAKGNIRSGPSTEFDQIGKVVRDVILRKVEKKGDWVKVYHPQVTGWIAKQLIWP